MTLICAAAIGLSLFAYWTDLRFQPRESGPSRMGSWRPVRDIPGRRDYG